MACTLVGASLLSVPLLLSTNAFNGLLAVRIAPSLLVLIKEGFHLVLSSTFIDVLLWGRGVDIIDYWTVSGARDQWHQVWGLNGCALPGVALGRFASIIGAPCGHCLLAGFVVLGQAEARFIKVEIFLQSDHLLRSEGENAMKTMVNVWANTVRK